MSSFGTDRPVAVVVARGGRLPAGADEAVAEAGGLVIVLGSGACDAAGQVVAAEQAWWCDTGIGLQPARVAQGLAPLLEAVPLVVMPSSPDGRDLAPRVAAQLDRPLIAQAVNVRYEAADDGSPTVVSVVSRLDDRVLVPISVHGTAVATLMPGSRSVTPVSPKRQPEQLEVSGLVGPVQDDGRDGTPSGAGSISDPVVLEVLEPDPETMDLPDAIRVMAGGAGLVAGRTDEEARMVYQLLVRVAAAAGASAGATRVATDAGWIGYERQIGTTGVAIDPELYIAFGVSGATQHTGGLGTPRHIVSVNLDASCPMTAMADLGLVTDAGDLLVELGRRFGVAIPTELDSLHGAGTAGGPGAGHA